MNPRCDQDVYIYIELPEEAGCPPGFCGKLDTWLYGFWPAAAVWEKRFSQKLEGCAFQKGDSCGAAFYHPGRGLSCVVYGDDFTLCGTDEDVIWIHDLRKGLFVIKLRANLGPDTQDDEEAIILGRIVRWTGTWIVYEAGPKHGRMFLDHLNDSRPLAHNGEKDFPEESDWDQGFWIHIFYSPQLD